MKNIKYILLAIVALPLFFSCEDSKVYDGDPRVKLSTYSGSFYVQDVPDATFDIEVQLVSAPLGHPVEITFKVVEEGTTARAGVDYELPASVTIPAGENLAKFKVKGLYSGLADGAKRTLKFNIVGPSNATSVPSVSTYTLSMQKYCVFVPEAFVGAWAVADVSSSGDKYNYDIDVALKSFDQAKNEAVFTVVGLWEDVIPVEVVMNASDPAKFTAKIPKQNYLVHPTYGQISIENYNTATTSFSSCELKVNTNYKVTNATLTFDNVTSSSWTKK